MPSRLLLASFAPYCCQSQELTKSMSKRTTEDEILTLTEVFSLAVPPPSNCILGAHEHLYDDIGRICGNWTMGKSSKVP